MNRSHIGILLLLCGAAPAHTLNGKVTDVLDGNALVVTDDKQRTRTVRMAGIETPVSGQAYSRAAKKSLQDLALGKTVAVEWDTVEETCAAAKTPTAQCPLVGRIAIDGVDINLEQVKRGLAWHCSFRMNEQTTGDRTAYTEAETEAKKRKVGLWKDANPVPPWNFKRGVASQPKKHKPVN